MMVYKVIIQNGSLARGFPQPIVYTFLSTYTSVHFHALMLTHIFFAIGYDVQYCIGKYFSNPQADKKQEKDKFSH